MSSIPRFLLPLAVPIMLSAGSLSAQRVLLRIHPHAGDTLHMKLEQRFEMSSDASQPPPASHPHSSPPSNAFAAPTTAGGAGSLMTATMLICTHTVILASTATGTDLQSITDSVSIAPAFAATLPMFTQTKRALEGKTVLLHMGVDGAMTLSRDAHGASDTAAQAVPFAQIPAVLPAKPVQVGDSWARDLLVPLGAARGKDGLIRITFHLDSLGPDAAIAYISMHGTFSQDHGKDVSKTAGQSSGTLVGTMQVDRRLEWLTDSRMTVTLTSVVIPPGGTETRHVRVKITQWLRAVPGA